MMLALKPQHEDSVIGQLLGLKARIENHNINTAPFYNTMEKWEEKEYKAVQDDNIAEFNRLKGVLISEESAFNTILSEYSLSVSVFVNKYLL